MGDGEQTVTRERATIQVEKEVLDEQAVEAARAEVFDEGGAGS